MSKSLYQLEAKLGGELLDSLSAEASTASIRASFFDSDNKSTQRTPDAATLLYVIDPERTQGKRAEFILVTSHSTTDGVTTLSTVTRGLQRDNTIDVSGSAARAQDWDAGTPIAIATIPYNDNLMKAYFEGSESIPGDMLFGGDPDFNGIVDFNGELNIPIYQNAAARDAAITSPREGSAVKLTDEGIITDRLGGAWVTRAADTTANASESVTGRVRLNSSAQTDAATDISGGDPTVNVPSETARVIQDQKYTSAASSAGTDTYVITLIPAITAYAANQMFILEADVTNVGACTVNINGVGAQSIKLPDGNDPNDGDIIVGPNILTYDGTNFVLMSVVANTPGSAVSSQAGNGSITSSLDDSTNGAFSVSDNIDIDVAPFDTNDIVLVHYNVSINYVSTSTVETNKSFGSFSVLMDAAGIEWHSQRNISGAVGTGTPFDDAGQDNFSNANDDMTAMSEISSQITPDSETGTITVETPVWSGNNLRFVCNHVGNSNGTIQFRPDIFISAMAIKLA